jgi:hypothetical protein
MKPRPRRFDRERDATKRLLLGGPSSVRPNGWVTEWN